MTSQRICSWCQAVMGTKDTVDGLATHGICPDCFAQFSKGFDKPIEKKEPDEKSDCLLGAVA